MTMSKKSQFQTTQTGNQSHTHLQPVGSSFSGFAGDGIPLLGSHGFFTSSQASDIPSVLNLGDCPHP